MKPPTLADAFVKEWSRPIYQRVGDPMFLVRSLAAARKFVLDNAMSAYLADLAWASLITTENPHKSNILMESLRQAARLPHKITWIEYNFIAKQKRVAEEYSKHNPVYRDENVADKEGWLCWQHPKLDTAFMFLGISSHSFRRNDLGGLSRVPSPQTAPMAIAWRSDDGPPPWPRFIRGASIPAFDQNGNALSPLTAEAVLCGVPSYHNDNIHLVRPPHYSVKFFDETILKNHMFNPLQEAAGDLRYIWSLLATINDIKITFESVKPTKGFVSRGRWKRFCDHTIVHLQVPATRWRKSAAQVIAISRRRAHQVRGFWRKHWKRPLLAFCEHEFEADEAHITCKHCGGQRIWIHEHMRGDATLGFVLHDYSVEHGAES